jgi:hypothetical protein
VGDWTEKRKTVMLLSKGKRIIRREKAVSKKKKKDRKRTDPLSRQG